MEEVETINIAESAHMEVDNEEISVQSEDISGVEAKILMFKTSLGDLRKPKLSEIFYVRNLPWQIILEQRSTRIPKSLGFYLRCNGPQASTWSCSAAADLRLLKLESKPNIYSKLDDTFSREIRHVFSPDINQAGFSDFISWENLCDPRRGFLMDNKIEVQVYLKADVPRIEYVFGPNVHKDGPEITYFFELPNMSALRGEHTSRIFKIHNMPFHLVLQATPKEKPSALGFFLVCLSKANPPSWNCYVKAKFRLMNQNCSGEARTRTIKHLFCMAETRSGFSEFMSWEHFLDRKNGFIENDTAHFEIGVRADASIVSKIHIDWRKHRKSRKEIKMLYAVYNVSQLKEPLFGSTFYVRNLPWRVKLMKVTTIGPTRQIRSQLGVYLQCNYESANAWRCYTVTNFNLLKDDVPQFGETLQYQFTQEKKVFGFTRFISWDTLLDPEAGFVKNDSITVQVNLKAERKRRIK